MSDLLYVLSNAERAHVGPYFLDVGEAFFPGTAFACIIPAAWVFSLNGPEGVLLFVVDDYLVDRVVFSLVFSHVAYSFLKVGHVCSTHPYPGAYPAVRVFGLLVAERLRDFYARGSQNRANAS